MKTKKKKLPQHSDDTVIDPFIKVEEADISESKKVAEISRPPVEFEGPDRELLVDVYADKENLFVKAPLPGISAKDIKVSFHNDILTVQGSVQFSKTTKDKDWILKESREGNISRSLVLPEQIKGDKISAVLKDGILLVTLPKIKTAKQ